MYTAWHSMLSVISSQIGIDLLSLVMDIFTILVGCECVTYRRHSCYGHVLLYTNLCRISTMFYVIQFLYEK